MVTLRIFLMGIIGLVPSQGELRVVLPNEDAHGHVAILTWDPANNPGQGDGSAIQTRLRLAGSPNGRLLRGANVRFDPPPTGGLRYAGGLEDSYGHRRLAAATPSPASAQDFAWVLSMERLTDGLGFMDPAYYSGVDPNLVAARLAIGHGDAKTFSFGDLGNGSVPALRFVGVGRRPLLTARQAVADVVVVEIEYPAATQVITFRGTTIQSPPAALFTVDLRPRNGRIDVLIGNLSPLPASPECPVVRPEPALHFDPYRSMLALRSSYPDRLYPTVGTTVPGVGVDPARGSLPEVVRVLTRGNCPQLLAGIARPICMLARYQAPE